MKDWRTLWDSAEDSIVPTKENPLGAAGPTLSGNVQQSQAHETDVQGVEAEEWIWARQLLRVQVRPLVMCYVSLGPRLVILTSLD